MCVCAHRVSNPHGQAPWELAAWRPLIPMLLELTQRFGCDAAVGEAWKEVYGGLWASGQRAGVEAAMVGAQRVRRCQRAWLIAFHTCGGGGLGLLSRDVAQLIATSVLLPSHHTEGTVPPPPPETMCACAACGKVGVKLLRCATCKTVWYCSRACQRSDWKVHKRDCNARAAEQVPCNPQGLSKPLAPLS